MGQFDIHTLIAPIGFLTYLFLIATVLSGKKRMKLKYHRMLAISTIILATTHWGLIMTA